MSIEILGLQKAYEARPILCDIDLTVGEHEFVCILGPSGCGKSTLLNIIAGLDTPDLGEVLSNGERVLGPSNDRVMMFQGQSLFPWLSVLENVQFGLKLKKLPKHEQIDIAMKYLTMVKLEEFVNFRVHQLSGGMQQRVALARSLAIESPYILMDEPFSALDKQTINILREELEGLWRQLKNTILYVTHSVEEAIFFSDRIVMITANPGRIKRIFDVNLPRPRRVDDESVMQLRTLILKELRHEVELSEEQKKLAQ